MASVNNVPRDILESMRDNIDRRIKLSIKRMVNFETRKDKWEHRVLAFSPYRLFVFTAKSPTKVESSFHFLDIESIESKKPNHFVITTTTKTYTFMSLEADTEEVNHMVTHIGTSLKTVFPSVNLDKLIKKIEVQPSDRIRVMYDMMKTIGQKEMGPCGGFTHMYACMCDFHSLVYRDEVAWDVDTIYLSQDSRELCLRDFDHLKERDLVPIVSALIHNNWFTSLNANNVKLSPDVCNEVLRLVKKNEVIENLLLSGTGIGTDFIKKLATMSMSGTALQQLDLSNNMIDDIGAEHMFGSLSSRGKMLTMIDLSRTKVTSRGLNKIAESMNKSPHVFSSLQTLKLTHLTSNKVDDMQNMYSFLASPNMLSHLDLTGTDFELERLMAPLQRGCSQSITVLKLSRVPFTHKKSKDVAIPPSFKQFFASVYSLRHLDLSGARLPPEALKDLLLGLSSNRNLTDLHVDISGIDLLAQGAQYLQNCLNNVTIVSSLNISNIAFQDQDLIGVLQSIGQNKSIKQLAMGRVFQTVKPKNLPGVMDELVRVIMEEDAVLESLSLADSKLKDSMNTIINALGSNSSLTEIDISGNLMGDLGARMLSKALQINNKLKTIVWDKNCTGCQGFEDIADALEKNYTLKKMPIPVYDASAALRANPERTEQALQTIERLLQRNHSPQKYSSDQAYRLQQGFLISSTQQMVDRLVVQSQDTINALTMDTLEPHSAEVEIAKLLIKDADRSKTLLPRLHDIADQSQNTGSPIEKKLKEISVELKSVLEQQIKGTVTSMMESTGKHCKTIMKDQVLVGELQTGCKEKSSFPKDFTKNVLDGVDTDIFNKLSELNLAVAAHISDRIIDEVIERLTKSHKTLTDHLNQKKKDVMRRQSKKTEENETNLRTKDTGSPHPEKEFLTVPKSTDSPKIQSKRKSMHARKIRPQSVIDGLDNDTDKLPPPQKPVSAPVTPSNELIESFDDVPELSSASKLSHATKNRPKRPKNVRPNTRQSALPATTEVKVDEDVDTFFSTPSTSSGPTTTTTNKADESPKTSSNKSTPETRKKSGGLFGFGNKDGKEKEKEQKKMGAFSGLFKKGKPSPPPVGNKRVSNVQEEEEEDKSSSNSSSLQRSMTENNPPRASIDRKQSDRSTSSSSARESLKSEKTSSVKGDTTPDRVSVKSTESEPPSGSDGNNKETEVTGGGSVKEAIGEEKRPLISPKTKRTISKEEDEAPPPKVEEEKEEVVSQETEEKKEVKAEEGPDDKSKEDKIVETSDMPSVKDEEESKPPKPDSSEIKPEPAIPVVPKRSKAPGGVGFGMNILAEMKEKQKRKSMMPAGNPSPKPPPDPSPKQETKEPLFGLKNLRQSGDRDAKVSSAKQNDSDDKNSVKKDSGKPTTSNTDASSNETPKRSSVKSSDSEEGKSTGSEKGDKEADKGGDKPLPTVGKKEADKVGDKPLPTLGKKEADKVGDKPLPTVEKKEAEKVGDKPLPTVGKKPSINGEKPAVALRPVASRPPIMKPKPPGNKPKPAPRTSLSQSEDTEPTSPDASKKENDTKQESGIVYDSATLKMSVKDKLAKKFGESVKDSSAKKEEKSPKPSPSALQEAKKDVPPPIGAKPGSKKENSLPRETTPEEIDKGVSLSQDDLQACELDFKPDTSSEMTDSGIVYDSDTLKMSVKDKASNLFGETVQKKTGSLPRDAKSSDMKDEPATTQKRPRSMFAVIDNRPDLKNKDAVDKKPDIVEEKSEDVENNDTKSDDKTEAEDQHSPTDVVMV